MTINYNLIVSTSKPWTLFKLLFRWKGSIWKSIIVELIVWLILYAIVSCCYRFWMDEEDQRRFEKAIAYSTRGLTFIPLDFMLGFFVTAILNRWKSLYELIGFIDNTALMVALYVRGKTPEAVMIRRNIIRYCETAQALIYREISMKTRRRYPTFDTIVDTGFLLPHEKTAFESVASSYGRVFLLFHWAMDLTYTARKKGLIESDYFQVVVEEEIKKFRTNVSLLVANDWVPIPLVYPQLICICVHMYFLVCLVARQYVISAHSTSAVEVDIYFPVMGSLQFIFYMGWMKIAEVMVNPFGEDDDDFETNRIIDRGMSLGLIIVTTGYGTTPAIMRDKLYDKDAVALYSEESSKLQNNKLVESLSHLNLAKEPEKKVKMVQHSSDVAPSERKESFFGKRLKSVTGSELNFFRKAGGGPSPHHMPPEAVRRSSLPSNVPILPLRKIGLANDCFVEEDENSISSGETISSTQDICIPKIIFAGMDEEEQMRKMKEKLDATRRRKGSDESKSDPEKED